MGRKYFFTFREKNTGPWHYLSDVSGRWYRTFHFQSFKDFTFHHQDSTEGTPLLPAPWFLSTSFSNIIAIVSPRGSTCADTNRLPLHIPCAHFPYAIAACLHLLILLLVTWGLDGVYLPLVWPVWPWHSPWNLHPSRGSSHMACGTAALQVAITRVKSTNVKCHYSPDEKTGKEREEKEREKTETFAKSLLSFFFFKQTNWEK